ncbi:MAG: hypothetical protein ACO3FV_09285 [Burkholderiaceae bacterium]|jgi:hypothetical protein
MGLFDLFKKKEGPKALAKKAYENAVRLSGDSKAVRAVKVRVAMRATAVLDDIFDDGVRSVVGYDEAVMIAVAGGEEPPPFPKATAETCYKKVQTPEGKSVGYVPLKYAESMFALGLQYQSGKITGDDAFHTAQAIGQQMANDLRLSAYAVQPIEPLNWMRGDANRVNKNRR